MCLADKSPPALFSLSGGVVFRITIMDFRKIEYFLTVAKYLNFSRASEEIHISHQALSKQIRLLEDELGTVLFERSTTKVALTEVGKRLYDSF